MKNVQISQELFMNLVKYFYLGMDEYYPEIQKWIESKIDSMMRRELYTKYKTAPTENEREEARKKYLDEIGVPESFRW